MTQHRPDLLPFARYDHFGLPYHGLVTKAGSTQNIALPNSTMRTWPAMPTSGETVLVRGPHAAAPIRTAEQQAADTAAGLQWANYAILSGTTRAIGGKALGENCHLYIDANAAWVVSVSMTPGTVATGCTADVWLESVYGIFTDHPSDFSMTRRKLATLTWNPTEADPDSTAWTVADVFTATYSQDGATAIVNVFSTDYRASSRDWMDATAPHSWYFSDLQHDVLRVEIAGTGSLVSGLVGTGITAAISRPYPIGTAWTKTSTPTGGSIHGVWKYRYAVQPDGTVGHLQKTLDTATSATGGYPSVGTGSGTQTLEYFGESIVSTWSYDTTSYPDLWYGTVTLNDVSRVCTGTYPVRTCTGPTSLEPFFIWFGGSYAAFIHPGFCLLYATYKARTAWRMVSHYGHSRAIAGDETTGEDTSWHWSVDPFGGTISSNETAEICYV